MNNDFDISTLHPGWLVSIMTTLWALLLRILIGRHYKAIDDMKASIAELKSDVATINGRFEERNHLAREYRSPRRRLSDIFPGDDP